jgi:hypothetical protein
MLKDKTYRNNPCTEDELNMTDMLFIARSASVGETENAACSETESVTFRI